MSTPLFILRQQDTKQDKIKCQVLFKSSEDMFPMSLKYSRIFTTRTFIFRFYFLQNPPCYLITALCRRRKVAAPLQTFCQTDSLVKFIRSRNPDHNSQKSWLITKLLLKVTSIKKELSSVIGAYNKFGDSYKPFNQFAKQNMI